VRIKFKKGFTPEAIADLFLQIVEDRGNVIGAVNIYFQEYDENMNVIRHDDEYLEAQPGRDSKELYTDYAADVRRKRLRAV